MIRVLTSGWSDSLAALASNAAHELVVCSPFVSEEGVRWIQDHVTPTFREQGHLTFVTNLSVKNVCELATDPRAVRSLARSISRSSVFHLPGLHAKVYIADEEIAVVTSANLTGGGLFRNVECGLETRDRSCVDSVRREVSSIAQIGAPVPADRLSRYCEALDAIRPSLALAQRSAQTAVRGQFAQLLDPVEDQLLALRLAQGPIHTVFARTIEYLLNQVGPLTTVELHRRIQSLHPDLCDDSVDRVIDGRRFGKKWKHAVRTAQQQLKKQERIKLENGNWKAVDR